MATRRPGEGLATTSIVTRARRQLSADLEGEAVVLGLERGFYYSMNEVASRVWGLLDRPRPIGDVIAAIVEEYDVDRATCERDVLVLLDRLRREDLVEVVSSG